jgi:rare lipoprotein A
VPIFEPRTSGWQQEPLIPFWVKPITVMPESTGYTEVGKASWYGKKFHGYKTSNGETYDMYKMSAAHKSLPIPSYVRVTNLSQRTDPASCASTTAAPFTPNASWTFPMRPRPNSAS